MAQFREEQRFPWVWAIPLFAAIPLYGLYQQTVLHRPFGNHPAPDSVLWVTLGFILALGIWLTRARLITEVREDVLSVRFFLLWPGREIPWSEIARAEAVTYRPIRDYGGWGVRRGAAGMAYNVSGKRGVSIHLRNGENLLVGSQRAEELAQAIAVRTRS
jgi:hypothetical protein